MKRNTETKDTKESDSKEAEKASEESLMEEYIKSLSEVEKSTMKIAEEHLKTSFSLKKSIGYMKWLAKRETS